MDRRKEQFLESVANRLVHLMQRAQSPRASMQEAESLLSEASLLNHSPPWENVRQWAQSLIVDNPPLQDVVNWAMSHDLQPNRCESVHELITSLIPSEGGL